MNTENQKDVYAIIPAASSDKPDYWHRIGRSFKNTDGSETILLNSLPLNGRLILRPPSPRTSDRTSVGSTPAIAPSNLPTE